VRGRPGWVLAALLLAVLVATLLSMCLGSVSVPLSSTLRFLATGDAGDAGTTTLLADIRMPRVVTAALAGAGLGIAGLLMQTLFANPLADPYILGVSSGASLGVALAVLGTGAEAAGFTALFTAAGRLGTVVAAGLGAFAVLAVVLLIGRWVRSVVSLLIIGVMIGSAVSAVVSLLLAYADPTRAQKFMLWGLGSVTGTTWPDIAVLAPVLGIGLVLAMLISPAMNALLLGERYAASMGVHVRRIRRVAIIATALLAGAVTAFCGPIAFLGIAVPHLTRSAMGRADHRWLVPGTALLGAALCQLCALVAQSPGTDGVLPLNVVTAVVGAPVVVFVLLRSRALAASAP
jgi:iron complex transport system permease protein